MYIFSFEFFDDFEFSFFKIIKKFKTKIVHVANEPCCKYEKVSMKNILYFTRSKIDKFGKILDSLDWNHWIENMGIAKSQLLLEDSYLLLFVLCLDPHRNTLMKFDGDKLRLNHTQKIWGGWKVQSHQSRCDLM
jgi:hypothetical protein